MSMTIKELSTLTQKQIREYVVMTSPGISIPKRWENKTKALDWVAKNIFKTTGAIVEPPAELDTVPVIMDKPARKAAKGFKRGEAVERRFKIADDLRDLPSGLTAMEIANSYVITSKAALDDLCAIRHNRGGHLYLKLGARLVGKQEGRTKVFFIHTD